MDRRSPPESPTPTAIAEAVQRTLEVRQEFHSGPIPPPEQLEAYDRIVPGVADRIVAMAERRLAMAETQMQHRIRLETQVISSDIKLAGRGQKFGYSLGLGALGVCAYLGSIGADLAAAASFIGAVGMLIATAVLGRKQRDTELRRKGQDISGPARR